MKAPKECAQRANDRQLEIDAAELFIQAEHRLEQMMNILG